MTPAFATVVDAFAASLCGAPEKTAVHLVDGDIVEALSYETLYRDAARTAAGLTARGLARGDRVIVALPTSRAFFAVYFGALFSGVIPVVVPPTRPGRANRSTISHDELADIAGARFIIVEHPREEASSLPVLTAAELCDYGEAPLALLARPNDVAHLQATSGSTRTPRLAVIRHGNIAANVDAIGRAIRHRSGDILVTWLPFFHDMGIIGVSYALQWQCPLVAADPVTFVRNQMSWPRMISRFRGTLSPAPNSAYQICARVAARRPPGELDLSSWRVALCGAEPVHDSTLRQFQEVFGPHGFRAETMLPVYGLAEATLAATIPDPDEVYSVDEVDAATMVEDGRCVPAAEASQRRTRLVSVGTAIPGHAVRVVDSGGEPLDERMIGEIEVAGPGVIDGYWNEQNNTGDLKRPDGFLRTGDLGYLANGRLFVTGRVKEIIIVGGRNLSPVQVETLVEPLAGSSVAACGVLDPRTRTESVHLLIESATLPRIDAAEIEERTRAALAETFGVTGVVVHWLPRGGISRTSSGKIQRYRCREWAASAASAPAESLS
jgi:fatty-acyl-CoA synthase